MRPESAGQWADALDAELEQRFDGVVSDQIGFAYADGSAAGVEVVSGEQAEALGLDEEVLASADGRWHVRWDAARRWWVSCAP